MIVHICALSLAVFASTGFAAPLATAPASNPALHALFEREFRRAQAEFPEYATLQGVDTFNDRLHDASLEAVARRKAHGKAVLGELVRFDAKKLSTQDQISLAMMTGDLRREQTLNALYGDLPFGTGFDDGWLRISPGWGPHTLLPLLAKATPFRNTRDYENYLQRLSAIPRLLAQTRTALEAGIKSGWVPPRVAMLRVPGQLATFSGTDITATPLYAPFRQIAAAVAEDDKKRLVDAATKVLAEKVHPAFAQFRQYLENTYLPACSVELAASKLPAGMAYYEQMVRMMTTTSLSAGEIHATGKGEVSRIRAEMDKVAASTGFKGSFAEFLRSLQTNPRMFHTTAEEMLTHYRDIAKRADAELPKLFAELPRLPYGIRPMEPYEGDNAEHYTGGALDGSRAGFFEANTNNLSRRAKYEMEAVLLHETVPGHHLQTARAQELKGLPSFRRDAGYVAYGEGWALYAESLGNEMGMYTDAYSRFGKLSAEMWRACRLVIDTGLHAFGWTRDQAIRYLADNAGISESSAIAEVDRYILWPGQALGYKIGELKIKALRAKARRALGSKFDLRRFHNALLDDGALPLDLLEVRIDHWIAREAAGK